MENTKIKVAINGFGRIGRAFLKIAWDRDDIEIVAINDLGSIESLAYLLKYDTVYGKWKHNIEKDESNIIIDGKKVKFISEKILQNCPGENLILMLLLNQQDFLLHTKKRNFILIVELKKWLFLRLPKEIVLFRGRQFYLV